MNAAPTEIQNGRYDANARRRGMRKGREKGVWIYLPLEELIKAGFSGEEPVPLYRVWGQKSGGLFVRLYRQAESRVAA